MGASTAVPVPDRNEIPSEAFHSPQDFSVPVGITGAEMATAALSFEITTVLLIPSLKVCGLVKDLGGEGKIFMSLELGELPLYFRVNLTSSHALGGLEIYKR